MHFHLTDFLSHIQPLTQAPLFEGSESEADIPQHNHPGWASLFEPLLHAEMSLSSFIVDDEAKKAIAQAFHLTLESMVGYGFSVNQKMLWQDFGPLHQAAQAGCQMILTALIKLGADVNGYSDGDSGSTPLYLAARENQLESARILIAHGADVNRRSGVTGFNELPLHVATSVEMCVLLVKSGCPVNAKSSAVYHESALHWAAHCARPDMVLALLRLGAQDFSYPGRGSALDVARKVHFQTCSVMGGREWDLKTTRLVVTLLENPDLGELLAMT